MQALLDRIRGLKILVIGDLMLDHYIWGDVSRISPEAPVPVVNVDQDTWAVGGAGNVALNLRALGASVEVCGILGHDGDGARLRALLEGRGVVLDPAFASDAAPTIVKTRVIVRGQQLCRLDRELPPPTYGLAAHRERIRAKLPGVDALAFSDYAKGALGEPLLAEIIAAARAAGVFVALDPKPTRPLAFTGVDLLTPNRAESLLLAGIALEPHEPYPEAAVCAGIYKRHAPRHLVITLGAEGMLLSEEGRPSRRIPTYAREVFDVSGAGDTSIAALTAALAAGAPLEDAAHLANTAAGVVVAKIGTATPTPEEILAYHPEG